MEVVRNVCGRAGGDTWTTTELGVGSAEKCGSSNDWMALCGT